MGFITWLTHHNNVVYFCTFYWSESFSARKSVSDKQNFETKICDDFISKQIVAMIQTLVCTSSGIFDNYSETYYTTLKINNDKPNKVNILSFNLNQNAVTY